MRPTDPTSDSLISGMSPQNQIPQPVNPPVSDPSQSVYQPAQPVSSFSATPQATAFSAPEVQQPASPFVQATDPLSASVQNPVSPEPVQPFAQAQVPVESAFINPQPIPANQFEQSVPSPVIQPASVQPNIPQSTSPYDTPPAPPQQQQAVQNPVNLDSAVVSQKPKKKVPIFLIILLLLVVVVLGAVGYLAYQNYNLNKNAENKTATQPTLKVPATIDTDPYSGYTSYTGKVLAVEFMVPSGWNTEESEDPDMGNQKMIKSNSPDFAYAGSEIAGGFEFRIGPVTELSKKYDSFEAFSAEENADNSYTLRSINGVNWLVKGNEAKTLLGSSPITVALYSSSSQAVMGTEIFNKVLNSFKFVDSNTPETNDNPLPTSASLQ